MFCVECLYLKEKEKKIEWIITMEEKKCYHKGKKEESFKEGKEKPCYTRALQ